jgi:hypothetical protein
MIIMDLKDALEAIDNTREYLLNHRVNADDTLRLSVDRIIGKLEDIGADIDELRSEEEQLSAEVRR